MKFTEDDKKLLLNTVAKHATDDELNMFIHLCETYGLDPFLKEIWFMKTPKKIVVGTYPNGSEKWDYPRLPNGEIDYAKAEAKIMTSRDGYLKVAQGHKEYVGPPISFAVCEGDEFEVDAEKYSVHHKFGSKRGKIVGAWSRCDRKGKNPSIIYVPFSEYFANHSTTWKQYPTAMIIKVAETFTLKRQFGITGMVTQEELAVQDDNIAESLDRVDLNHKPVLPGSNTAPTKEETPVKSEPGTTSNKATEPTPAQKPVNPVTSGPAPEQKPATEQKPEQEPEQKQKPEPEQKPAPVSEPVATSDSTEPKNKKTVKIILGRLQNIIEKNDIVFRTVKFLDDGTIGGICAQGQDVCEILKTTSGGGTYNVTVLDECPEDDRDGIPDEFQSGRLVLVEDLVKVETQAA